MWILGLKGLIMMVLIIMMAITQSSLMTDTTINYDTNPLKLHLPTLINRHTAQKRKK